MPIASPMRYTARDFFGETVHSDKDFNRDWWTKNIQQFYGRENYCPADGHFIVALIYPRNVLLSNALNDNAGDNSFANDKNYLSNYQLFYKNSFGSQFIAQSGTLSVIHRFGSHHGFLAIEKYADYFEWIFNNKMLKFYQKSRNLMGEFKDPVLYHDFDWNIWNDTFYDFVNFTNPSQEESIESKMSWLLGNDAIFGWSLGGYSGGSSYNEETSAENEFTIGMMGELNGKPPIINQMSIGFGGYKTADLYWPSDEYLNAKGINGNISLIPIIYLHPYSYAPGYVPNYVGPETKSMPFYYYMVLEGHVVIAFDQIGFGMRINEGSEFYDRYGYNANTNVDINTNTSNSNASYAYGNEYTQSKFSHMIQDVTQIIDVLECLTIEAREEVNNSTGSNKYAYCQTGETFTITYTNDFYQLPNVDISQLTVVGYALGGSVALHSSVIDKRISNIGVINGFTPFRNNTNDLANSGNWYYYQAHGLIPKLGYFVNKESEIPYDYIDLFEAIAPRKTLIYAAINDRNANFNSVKECIQQSKVFWSKTNNSSANLTIEMPNQFSEFGDYQFAVIARWLNG